MATTNECTRLKLFDVPNVVDILDEYKGYLSEDIGP